MQFSYIANASCSAMQVAQYNLTRKHSSYMFVRHSVVDALRITVNERACEIIFKVLARFLSVKFAKNRG
jgi:hypothetical protein